MQRRKYLAAMGSIAAGGAAVMGTGAFNNLQAQRSMEIRAMGDSSALLALKAEDEDRASTQNGQITFDFTTGHDGNEYGLNPNARTRFDQVFSVTNNGTEDIIFAIGTKGSNVYGDIASVSEVNSVTGGAQDRLKLVGDAPGMEKVVARAPDKNQSGDDPYLNAGKSGYGTIGLNVENEVVTANTVNPNGDLSKFGGYRILTPGEKQVVDFVFHTESDPSKLGTYNNIVILASELGEDETPNEDEAGE